VLIFFRFIYSKLGGGSVDFLYHKNKKPSDLTTAESIADRIELGPEAAELNEKYQTNWDKRAKGKITDADLVKSVLEISKSRVLHKDKRPRPS
jgi:hypothetical protein